MSDWTFPVMELLTGAQVIDHLPCKVNEFSDQLGVAVGSLSGSLPVGVGPVDPDEALLPAGRPSRVIVPCYKTRPLGAYLITALGQYGPRSGEIPFTAERIDCILKRRRIWSTLQFVQQDQLDIARALIGYGLGLTVLPGLDAAGLASLGLSLSPLPTAARLPWITLDESMSGKLRDRFDADGGYQMQQDHVVADMVRNLTELDDGFDYRLNYTRDPITGALGVTIQFGYPRFSTAEPFPLEWPGNIADWRMGIDTSDSVTMVRIFGAGSGVSRIMGPIQTDYTAHDNGWPLLMGSASSTASDISTLAEDGRARLNKFSGPNNGWLLSVPQDVIFNLTMGGNVQLRIRDKRWSDLKVVTTQIRGWKISPSRQGRAGRVDVLVAER